MIESIFFNPWIWIVGGILAILLLIAVILVIVGIRDDSYMDGEGFYMAAGALGFVALILAGFYFAAILPPYDTDFYQTYRITGQVENIEAAFSGDEGTMSQVFVAEVEGVDEFIRSDDQRFRTVNAGDEVNLVCSLEFRYFQEPWYECAFGGPK